MISHHAGFLEVAKVRAVLLDAVGTLLHPTPGAGEVYGDVGRRYGLDLPRETIAERFHQAFATEDATDSGNWTTSEARERQRWQRIVAAVFPELSTTTDIFQTLWDHFGNAAHWQADPAAKHVLAELRALGYRIGLASNFDLRLTQVLHGLGLSDLCGDVFISSQVGWRKPATEFYRAIEARLGVAASEMLMIGDSLTNDYEGARQAGWQALLVASADAGDAIARIDGLAELPRLLENRVQA